MSDEARKEGFVPPPHINAEAHKRVMEWLRQASPEEVFESVVEAGIYTPDGRLAEPYANEEGEEATEPFGEEREQVEVMVPKELVSEVLELIANYAG